MNRNQRRISDTLLRARAKTGKHTAAMIAVELGFTTGAVGIRAKKLGLILPISCMGCTAPFIREGSSGSRYCSECQRAAAQRKQKGDKQTCITCGQNRSAKDFDTINDLECLWCVGKRDQMAARAMVRVWPISKHAAERIEVEEIIKAAEVEYGLKPGTILSKNREAEVVYVRTLAITLARERTTMSLSALGRCFQRDHSTIMHALAKGLDTQSRSNQSPIEQRTSNEI